MAFPLIPVLLAVAGGAAVYTLLKPKPRFVGDRAVAGPLASADQVEVMVPDLLRLNSSAKVGPTPGMIPPGTMSVLVAVLGANKEQLQGPIVAFGTVPVSPPLGSLTVNRADVKAVIRGGKIARSADGKFAGERSKRFAG